ncbi:energy-coupled thiamine transporter ThiT [Brevibacillus sp. SYSU BS000544]|uniref:energy-coupled thiamine transporter ThiT n=1 Tax=Brevibacillus sp. SYSU BS000544 TaxID=3416443 RepID=UPI003CE56327
MNRNRLLVLLEIAIMSALAFVLGELKLYEMPQGGSISLVMLPIVLIALRRGLVAGLAAGFLVGELNHLIGGYVVHPIQLILDYPLAYTVVGLVGLVRHIGWETKRIVMTWTFLLFAISCRFLLHFTSGIIWFGEYAPEGVAVTTYSFLYNISYLLPELIITGTVLSILLKKAPHLFISPVQTGRVFTQEKFN